MKINSKSWHYKLYYNAFGIKPKRLFSYILGVVSILGSIALILFLAVLYVTVIVAASFAVLAGTFTLAAWYAPASIFATVCIVVVVISTGCMWLNNRFNVKLEIDE